MLIVLACILHFFKNLDFDPNTPIRESDGMRPIHYAVYKRAPEVIRVLAERGADLNAVDFKGQTAGMVFVNLCAIQYSNMSSAGNGVSPANERGYKQ